MLRGDDPGALGVGCHMGGAMAPAARPAWLSPGGLWKRLCGERGGAARMPGKDGGRRSGQAPGRNEPDMGRTVLC